MLPSAQPGLEDWHVPTIWSLLCILGGLGKGGGGGPRVPTQVILAFDFLGSLCYKEAWGTTLQSPRICRQIYKQHIQVYTNA